MKCFSSIVITLIVGLLACTFAQEGLPSNNELLEQVSNNFNGLNNINASALPNIEDAKNLFKQKCDKNGGPTAYENAKDAYDQMALCLQSLVNTTELVSEMEKAKPTGDLDLVFKKYCRKSPILKKCVSNFNSAVEPCLEENERDNKKIIQNITESLLSFICFKEGDRIALFIAAGGPECFQAKQSAVQQCANNTFGSYIPATDHNTGSFSGLNSLPPLILGIKECSDIVKLQTCVVQELEACSDPTPANIVDSLFNFIKRVTPCDNLLKARSAAATRDNTSLPNSSAVNTVTTLSATVLMALSLRFM